MDEISIRLENVGTIEHLSADNFEVFLVTTCWLELGIRYSKAIQALIANDLRGSVGPIERAIWELWIEWRFLKAAPARNTAARKVILTAKIEALEFGSKHSEFRAIVLEQLRADVAALAAAFPEAHTELSEQRKRKRFHWSGKSYSTMERELVPDSAMYKVLSWDAHGTLSPIRDLRLKRDGSMLEADFGRTDDDPMAQPERIAWTTGGVLYYMFCDWAEFWHLPPIQLPPA
jgi:hypothetical protein